MSLPSRVICPVTAISLPLGGLLGQDVALISFEPLDLAGAGHFETLSRGSFGLHLRHIIFLLVIAHIVQYVSPSSFL